jgi:hypothetical protein
VKSFLACGIITMSLNIFGFLFLAGCKSITSTASDTQAVIPIGKDNLWPEASAQVCWEKNLPDADWERFSGIRQKVASAVKEQYKLAGFEFSGWNICEPGSRGIRVQSWIPSMDISPSVGGMVKSFGARLDGLMNGMGFFVELPKETKDKYCQNEELCIIGTALHEFGHGVGLLHEMNRPGSPCPEDQTAGWGSGGGSFYLPPYDPYSIMNYCFIDSNYRMGRKSELSQTDISVIKDLYTSRPVLYPEKMCQNDGFSWVSLGDKSCCRASNDRQNKQRPYPICDSKIDTSFNDHFPQKNEKSPYIQGFLKSSKAIVSAELPWSSSLASINCWSGEIKANIVKNNYEFILTQPADPNFQKFICNQITFYNRQTADSSTEAVIFPNAYEIPIDKEISFQLKASDGIRAPIVEGQIQLTADMVEKIAARSPKEMPPMGSLAGNNLSAVQTIKINGLSTKMGLVESSLLCTVNGQKMEIISGLFGGVYDPDKKLNSINLLEYNFSKMEKQAECTQIKMVFRRFSDDKKMTSILNFRQNLIVRPGQKAPILEMLAPACISKFAPP